MDTREFVRFINMADRMMNDNRSDQAVKYYLMAIRLYVGEYMSNLYQSWCDEELGNLQNLQLHSLKQVGRYLLDRNQPDNALSYFRNALKIDEYSEELYIDIMRCHVASGNKKSVEEEYQRLQKPLREELNSNPRAETTRIYQTLIS